MFRSLARGALALAAASLIILGTWVACSAIPLSGTNLIGGPALIVLGGLVLARQVQVRCSGRLPHNSV